MANNSSFIPTRNELINAIGAVKGTIKNKLMPDYESQMPPKESLPPMTDEEYRIFVERYKMHQQMMQQ
jgi:hypothetical protein